MMRDCISLFSLCSVCRCASMEPATWGGGGGERENTCTQVRSSFLNNAQDRGWSGTSHTVDKLFQINVREGDSEQIL